jgi:dTDP-4-dehydrorhamnose 3,5-epimerase|tara:strand:+ start:654 stop:1187 length:534 start_codon:yes stop_codon:yes gene_type:complete
MKIISTKFSSLKLIEANVFADKRGYLREIYKKKILKKDLVFHYFAKSKKNVFRGFHFQTKNQQEKLVTVLEGSIIDMCIDLRKKSKTFGKMFKVLLSEKNKKSIFIPKGFAHGYLSLEKSNLVYFKNSNYRDKDQERGILWNDIDLNIKWPYTNPIISKKDKLNITLKEFVKRHKYL